ncbi:MAG: hypothetical protein ETSY1_40210, partial [Candidatus Entotheonella factor]
MIYIFEEYELDTSLYVLRHLGRERRLRAKVFSLLLYLLQHRDRVISKDELSTALWPEQFISDTTLETTLSAARRAVGDSGRAQRVIATIIGQGYRFVAEVSEQLSPEASVLPELISRDEDSAPAESHAAAHPVPSDPAPVSEPLLAKRPFIGRQSYLRQFATCLQETLAGRPRLLLITGEAGIGKTRFLQKIQTIAARHHLDIRAGHCVEAQTLTYLPFIEAMGLLTPNAVEQVEPILGADAESLRWLYPGSPPSPADTAGFVDTTNQAMLQSFAALTRTVIKLAQHRPMLLSLDDLHWADPPCLELLSHLVFNMAQMASQGSVPLLVVGTYRPGTPGDIHVETMGRLRREAICEHLELMGFDEAEISEMLQALLSGRPSPQLLTTVSEVTLGLPLFVQELTHHLSQRQALHEHDGYVATTAATADLRLPDGVTEAILTRTQAVSADCRRVLILAACLGERFSLQTLQQISAMDEEQLLDLLEESMYQHVLISEGQDFQFAHPLIRHVFYNAPSVARRQRFHWQIVQALAHMPTAHPQADMVAMAHHALQAGAVAEAETVVRYAQQAGDYAFSQYDWRQAGRYYTAVLSAAANTDEALSPQRLAELNYLTGVAYARAGDTGLAIT